MKRYNIDLIRQKRTDIRRARKVLDKYAAMTKEGFLSDDTVISSAKY